MSAAMASQQQQQRCPPSLALSCPLCSFVTVDLHRLRKHAMADHLRNGGGGRFRYKLYTCSECAACSTDVDIVQDHATVAHRQLRPLLLFNEVCLTLPSSLSAGNYNKNNGLLNHGENVNGDSDDGDSSADNANWLVCKAGQAKYTCTVCHCSFPCQVEAAFHAAVRHQISAKVESDLTTLGRLSEPVRVELRHRIRLDAAVADHCVDGDGDAGVGRQLKAAGAMETALLASVELHLRLQCSTGELICSDCDQRFNIAQLPEAVGHINDAVRRRLPDFMTTSGASWSLHRREEWVWVVPDSQDSLNKNKDTEQQQQQQRATPPPPPTPPTPLDADAASNDASSSSAAAAASAAPATAATVGASRRKKLPVRYVPPGGRHLQQTAASAANSGSSAAAADANDADAVAVGAQESSLASARHEAALRSGGWQVVAIDDDLFACSHCPELMAARPQEIRLHIVAEHLGVPSLSCAHCALSAGCQPEPILTHCRTAHPDQTPQFVANSLHRSLCRLVPSPNDPPAATNSATAAAGVVRNDDNGADDEDDEEDGDIAAAAVLGEVDDDMDREDDDGEDEEDASQDGGASRPRPVDADDDNDNDEDDDEDEETAAAVAALEGAAGLVMDGEDDDEGDV